MIGDNYFEDPQRTEAEQAGIRLARVLEILDISTLENMDIEGPCHRSHGCEHGYRIDFGSYRVEDTIEFSEKLEAIAERIK